MDLLGCQLTSVDKRLDWSCTDCKVYLPKPNSAAIVPLGVLWSAEEVEVGQAEVRVSLRIRKAELKVVSFLLNTVVLNPKKLRTKKVKKLTLIFII